MFVRRDVEKLRIDKVYYSIPITPNPNSRYEGRVSKILSTREVDENDEEVLVATGVEFVDASGNFYTLEANREVIISAGVVETPKLLTLSGTIWEVYRGFRSFCFFAVSPKFQKVFNQKETNRNPKPQI